MATRQKLEALGAVQALLGHVQHNRGHDKGDDEGVEHVENGHRQHIDTCQVLEEVVAGIQRVIGGYQLKIEK